LVAVVALAVTACSTRYQPQLGPRVSVVMEGGTPAYVRDGKTYPHGFAGSGLVEAVGDDAEAREAAETYQSRMTSGFVLYLVGTGCLLTSVLVGAPTLDENDRSSSKDAVIGGTLICALAGLISGGVLLASAQPYQLDAINIYNDNVERRRVWVPTGVPYAPPVVAPPAAPVAPPPAAPTVAPPPAVAPQPTATTPPPPPPPPPPASGAPPTP